MFILRTTLHLGRLHTFKVWHDNSGTRSGRSWYIDNIGVLDVEEGVRYAIASNVPNPRKVCHSV